jgi:hypothetical protein
MSKVASKPTEAEMRLLAEVMRHNDHPDGFRSYVIMGYGSKGSNFHRMATVKRASSLIRKGMLAETPHGYEITEVGRAMVAADREKEDD